LEPSKEEEMVEGRLQVFIVPDVVAMINSSLTSASKFKETWTSPSKSAFPVIANTSYSVPCVNPLSSISKTEFGVEV